MLAVDLFTNSNRSANGAYLVSKIVTVIKEEGIRTYNSQLMQHFWSFQLVFRAKDDKKNKKNSSTTIRLEQKPAA